MAKPTIEVLGAKELRRALTEAADKGLSKELREANLKAAGIVVAAALPNVPVATGALRQSVKATGGIASAAAKAGSPTVPYAAAIHWGRKRGNVGRPPGNYMGANAIKGRPFLRQAAERSAPAILAIYQKHMAELADAIANAPGVLHEGKKP